MTTVKHKHINRDDYDLYKDVENIKAALFEASEDVKGKAGEILSDSVEDIKDRSTKIKNNVANYTSEKPFNSLGIAFLFGVVLGFFLNK